MLSFTVYEGDIHAIQISEATDDNKIQFFISDSKSLSFSLTDTEYTAFTKDAELMMSYVSQDNYRVTDSGVETYISSFRFTESETTSADIDIIDNKIFMTFNATRSGTDYTFLIYITKSQLNKIDEGDTKMIETTVPETSVVSAVADNDGSNDFVLFTFNNGNNNIKISIQAGLITGFQTDLDAENTAIQEQTSPPDYDIVQTASGISGKNLRSIILSDTQDIDTITISRAKGNNTSAIFSGTDSNGYAIVINVMLDRTTLSSFNTSVQALT